MLVYQRVASRGPVPIRLLATELPQRRVACWLCSHKPSFATAAQNGASPRPTCILLCGNPTSCTYMGLSNSIYPKEPERLAMIHGMVIATVLSTPTGAASPLLAAKKATANSSASVVRQKPWESSSGHTKTAGICGCSFHPHMKIVLVLIHPQTVVSWRCLLRSSPAPRSWIEGQTSPSAEGGSFPSETWSWL